MDRRNRLIISVKAARINANKTQEEVAKSLGLSLNAYVRKENGIRRFYIDEIVKISCLFNVDINNFFESQCNEKTQNGEECN